MAAAPVPVPAVAPGLQISDSFRLSYSNFALYPANIVHKSAHPAALKGYRLRLDQFSDRLFQTKKTYVPFREFTGFGLDGGLQKKDAIDDITLREWLGDRSSSTPIGSLATKRDPKCRFIFISADNSRKPLNITQDMLLRILSYHQVMPGYLDFLSVFGAQNEARELRFSGFREQTSLSAPAQTLNLALGRSGRQFQLSYNLKAVACKSEITVDLTEKQWSIRQAAVHHQFDIQEGTTLWLVTQGHLSIKERVQEITAIHGRPEDRAFATKEECFRTSLTTHLLYCHWSVEEWRWYIQWLEDVIEKETDLAVYGTRGAQGQHVYTPDHIQMVQHREDKINEAIMVLEANADVLTSLRDYYKRLLDHKYFDLKNTCHQDIDEFATQLDDMLYDSKMQVARAKVLVKITADRKNLILQHLQSQATGKMEELTQLTIKIGTMSQREAIAMRIITVVTLIYLPATFVSTFFSTDIVKYQDPNAGSGNATDVSDGQYMGSYSEVAMVRWLQVTLPLTFLTLVIGWIAFKRSGKSADKEFESAQLPTYEDEPKVG